MRLHWCITVADLPARKLYSNRIQHHGTDGRTTQPVVVRQNTCASAPQSGSGVGVVAVAVVYCFSTADRTLLGVPRAPTRSGPAIPVERDAHSGASIDCGVSGSVLVVECRVDSLDVPRSAQEAQAQAIEQRIVHNQERVRERTVENVCDCRIYYFDSSWQELHGDVFKTLPSKKGL
jgi:hypothetical protein